MSSRCFEKRMSKRHRGAAVIVAILIVALAASTAAFAVWQQSLWVRQLENITDRAKADQLAASAIDVARDALRQDNDRAVDHLGEAWATNITLPAENALVNGMVIDQQGRFNLNNLVQGGQVSESGLKAFAKLLDNLNLKPSADLAGAVADWIKEDPNGMTDLNYLSLDPPYRAAHRPLIDVSELARIKGFNEEIIRTLSPYVTALQTQTQTATAINVNTASPEVVSAILTNLSVSDAKALLDKRNATPFKSQGEFTALLSSTVKCGSAPGTTLCYDVKSSFFTATARVISGRVEAGYTALLWRGSGPWPVILWRKDAAD